MSLRQFDDLAVLPAMTAPDCTPAVNDAAVCAALRWAKRAGADLPAVADLCHTLGLDLSGALQRARGAERRRTPARRR